MCFIVFLLVICSIKSCKYSRQWSNLCPDLQITFISQRRKRNESKSLRTLFSKTKPRPITRKLTVSPTGTRVLQFCKIDIILIETACSPFIPGRELYLCVSAFPTISKLLSSPTFHLINLQERRKEDEKNFLVDCLLSLNFSA